VPGTGGKYQYLDSLIAMKKPTAFLSFKTLLLITSRSIKAFHTDIFIKMFVITRWDSSWKLHLTTDQIKLIMRSHREAKAVK